MERHWAADRHPHAWPGAEDASLDLSSASAAAEPVPVLMARRPAADRQLDSWLGTASDGKWYTAQQWAAWNARNKEQVRAVLAAESIIIIDCHQSSNRS